MPFLESGKLKKKKGKKEFSVRVWLHLASLAMIFMFG